MKSRLCRLIITFMVIPCLFACSPKLLQKGPVAKNGYLIRNVNVFTAVPGKPVLEDMDVFIQEDIIAMVSKERLEVHGVEVIDGRGKTLLPGLIDMHTHMTGSMIVPWGDLSPTMPFNMEGCLYSGVTAVMDMSGRPVEEMNKLAAGIETGEMTGPHLFHCGMGFTGKGAHPVPMMEAVKNTFPWFIRPFFPEMVIQVESVNDMARLEKHLAARPDFTKIFLDDIPDGTPRMSPVIVKEIIRRSHEKGIPAVIHIGRNEDVKTAIECEADGIAHDVYKEPIDRRLARELAAKKMFVTPTVYVFHELGLFMNEKNYIHYTPLEWETMHPSAKKALQNPRPHHVAGGKQWADYYDHFKGPYKETLLQNLKVLKEEGVTIVAGTDSPNLGIATGGSLHVELEYLVEAGFTPEEALLAATSVPARVLREVFHRNVKFGTIENGKSADLLLVEGDPTKNIQDTQKIVDVFLQGKLLDRRKPGKD